MKYFFLFVSTLFICACGSNGPSNSNSANVDLSGFTTENVAGNGVRVKKMEDGILISEGYMYNGKKAGVWMTFNTEGRIKTLESYVNGLLTGPYLELDRRGQIELKASYNGGQYDGLYVKYKFGRPLIETPYKMGSIHGDHKEYFRNGKLQKMVQFSNGKQHGKMEYYDEDGNVTVEYTYKNGEKITGGIVKK